ncbi:ganglioside GM2 activator-like [Asterias rubens]|uniref:ganglioside GM2 activator-like n=1 Tax=Asterias rubens TaxID=7604 RepID=UPI0014554D41|nr:ganglioside GM2 activator-like [Asterias rubens]
MTITMGCPRIIFLISCFLVFSPSDGAFSWNSCQDFPVNAPLQVRRLSILPDPVAINDWASIDFDIELTRNFTKPLQVSLSIKKIVKVLWVWTTEINVPCVSQMGSCTYDVCDESSALQAAHGCPSEFATNGIPCTCPIHSGDYRTSSGPLRIYLDTSEVPALLESFLHGKYRTVLRLMDGLGDVGCVEYLNTIGS